MTACSAAIPLFGLGAGWLTPSVFFALGLPAVICAAAMALHGRMERRVRLAIQAERQRLALEMHDTLAQSFAGIGFQLQAARDDAAEGRSVAEQLETALVMVRRTHLEIKHTLTALREPPVTAKGNPAEALRAFARSFGNGRPPAIHSFCRGSWRRIPPPTAEAFFRIGQEAIVNIFRHAQASTVTIALVIGRNSARLSITDDGVGFPTDQHNYGMGLHGLSQRAKRVGAHVEITSAPGRGTSVSIIAPLVPHSPQRVQKAMNWVGPRQKNRWQTN